MRITRSTTPTSISHIERKWHLIDVANKTLGRTTNNIAALLQGKHKTRYSPNIDVGDYVVVINVKKIVVSGRKSSVKKYTYYSGYPGGLKEVDFKMMLERKPDEIIRHAVAGMLPKNKLRDARLARLHIYAEDVHPYADKFTSSK